MRIINKWYFHLKNIICFLPILLFFVTMLIFMFSVDIESSDLLTNMVDMFGLVRDEFFFETMDNSAFLISFWNNNIVFDSIVRLVSLIFNIENSEFGLYNWFTYSFMCLSWYICGRLFFVAIDSLMYFIRFIESFLNKSFEAK